VTTAPEISAIELEDGRLIAWEQHGPPTGRPVLFFHGTPSYRRAIRPDRAMLDATAVRIIAIDRPGYGLSTFKPGRRLIDWPTDVSRIADHLGLGSFGVIGHSGGGPHALACARFIGDRITVTTTVGGFCPFDSTASAAASQRLGQLAARVPFAIEAMFTVGFAARDRFPVQSLQAVSRAIAPADRTVLTGPDTAAQYMTRSSPTAAKAAAQDMAMFVRDWGFALSDIAGPVHLWHGTADANVPYGHSVYAQSIIPDSTLHTVEGGGHLLLGEHLGEMLRLMSATG